MTKPTITLYVATKGRGGYDRLEARRKGPDDAVLPMTCQAGLAQLRKR